MPRYFFNLYNDIDVFDEEGRELPDHAAAIMNATAEAREMMMETVSEGRINFSHRVEIADSAGVVLDTVLFADAVRVEG